MYKLYKGGFLLMADNRSKEIIVISDGKPGGVTEMHFKSEEDDKFSDRAKQQGLNVSDYKVQGKEKHSRGKAKK